MKRLILKSWQRGDTIVEVLIAVAIVSTIIMGGYLVTQRSSAAVRDGQEQSDVQQLLQAQVEHVRSLALAQKTSTGGIFAAGDFCIDDTDPANLRRISEGSSDFEHTCNKVDGYYNVRIAYEPSSNIFKLVGTWDKLGGGTNREQLVYRVYSGETIAISGSSSPSTPSSPSGGNASVGTGSTCGDISAGQPPCPTAPVPGHYRWYVSVINQSVNDPSTILGCTYDWADGTVQNFGASAPECREGYRTPNYFYDQPSPLPVYPALCGAARATYIMRLTMHLTTGDEYDETTFRIPQCLPD